MSDWQPIETAPKDGTVVFAATGNALCPAYFAHHAWRNWFKGCNYRADPANIDAFLPDHIWFEPTHWQPLPSPPNPQEQGSER